MIGAAAILGVITAIGALVLAVGSFRSHGLDLSRSACMALAWIVIILGVVLIFRILGA